MFFRFRRMRRMDPLQVAMTGVRMGERYLQVFCSDAVLTRGLATKAGLSGTAALVTPDRTQAARAEREAARAGVLIEVRIAEPVDLPWEEGSFDMAVIDDTGGEFAKLAPDARASTLAAVHRVVRGGGRAELIERLGTSLLARGASPADHAGQPAEDALRRAGFNPVRTLAERDGFRFVEGLKA